MRVGDLMTREVQTCSADDTLTQAAQIMWDTDCGCVPVVDAKGRIIGMLTDRDVCMAAYTQGRPLHEITVESVMSQDVQVCSPSDSPAMAQALMQQYKVRRLPVVDSERRVIGLLSLSDMAYCMQSQQTMGADGMTWLSVAHTLGAICVPRHFTPPPSEVPSRPSRPSVPFSPLGLRAS
jgi:CBS domain-containing protein